MVVRVTFLILAALLPSFSLVTAGPEATPATVADIGGIVILIEQTPTGEFDFKIEQHAGGESGEVSWVNETDAPRLLEIEQEGVVTTRAKIYPHDTLVHVFHQSGTVRFELPDHGVSDEIRV